MKQYVLRAAPLILVCCMFLFVLSPSASALFYYEDFISNMEVDGENEIITVTLPVDRTMLQVWNSDWSVIAREHGSSISFSAAELATYHFGIYPMYGDSLSVLDLPNGTSFSFSYSLSDSTTGYETPSSFAEFTYFNAAGLELRNDSVNGPRQPISDTYSFTFSLNKPDGSDSCTFALHLGDFKPFYSGRVILDVKEIKMGISISALYLQQQLTGKTNKLLEEVNKQLAEQGKTMEDILDQQQQTNDKFDKLPGQIGDEMQDVIDQEKEDANNTGNGSIDDMIELIPDYSTGLIKGIENLAGSLGYEGTECKLTMPALSIPALPGVTSEPITFMEEQEVDFEEWFNRMPSEIMAVTKAMFDIAVVIFCFIEFYGLVSELSNGAKRLEKE